MGRVLSRDVRLTTLATKSWLQMNSFVAGFNDVSKDRISQM